MSTTFTGTKGAPVPEKHPCSRAQYHARVLEKVARRQFVPRRCGCQKALPSLKAVFKCGYEAIYSLYHSGVVPVKLIKLAHLARASIKFTGAVRKFVAQLTILLKKLLRHSEDGGTHGPC